MELTVVTDLAKMIPYLDNCHMVIGNKTEIQVLSEEKTQNTMFYVWGNYLSSKINSIKIFQPYVI